MPRRDYTGKVRGDESLGMKSKGKKSTMPESMRERAEINSHFEVSKEKIMRDYHRPSSPSLR